MFGGRYIPKKIGVKISCPAASAAPNLTAVSRVVQQGCQNNVIRLGLLSLRASTYVGAVFVSRAHVIPYINLVGNIRNVWVSYQSPNVACTPVQSSAAMFPEAVLVIAPKADIRREYVCQVQKRGSANQESTGTYNTSRSMSQAPCMVGPCSMLHVPR